MDFLDGRPHQHKVTDVMFDELDIRGMKLYFEILAGILSKDVGRQWLLQQGKMIKIILNMYGEPRKRGNMLGQAVHFDLQTK
jgi:hypothetical protein